MGNKAGRLTFLAGARPGSRASESPPTVGAWRPRLGTVANYGNCTSDYCRQNAYQATVSCRAAAGMLEAALPCGGQHHRIGQEPRGSL